MFQLTLKDSFCIVILVKALLTEVHQLQMSGGREIMLSLLGQGFILSKYYL